MKLSDIDIEKAMESKAITIEPLFPNSINSASVELHLGNNFWKFDKNNQNVIDPKESIEKRMRRYLITDPDKPFILPARGFALGVVLESISINGEYIGVLDGKSSIGRLGTSVHITASTLNPGNKNLCMTLELLNETDMAIYLYFGMPIAQIMFEKLSSPCKNVYGSAALQSAGYGGTRLPQVSQYHKNFEPGKNEWQEFAKKLLK